MRLRIPKLPTRSPEPVRPLPPTQLPDHLRRAEWSVPLGVRTASEWAWRLIVLAIAVSGALWALAQISTVVIPVIVALLLAGLLHPIKAALDRVMPESLASLVTVLGTLAVLFGMFSFVGSQLSTQFGDLTSQVTQGLTQIRDWVTTTFKVSDTQITDYLTKAKNDVMQGGLGEKAAAAGLTAGHTVAGFFLAMFTLYFFLADGPGIWGWIVRLFPRGVRTKVHSSGLIAWDQISNFTRATLIVAAVDALGISIGAAILGVPFAAGIGLLVFFGAFVPVVGAGVSGAVAVLLALVALGPVKALIMLGVVIAVQQLESHLLQPLLIGRAMKVHPLAVILGIAAGVIVAGIVGALIAVPVVAVLNSVGHHLLDADPDVESPADALTPAQEAEAEDDAEATEARTVAGAEAAETTPAD